eukprot:Em0007g950a
MNGYPCLNYPELSSGLAPNNQATWNLLVSKHPKSPLPSPPSTPSAPLLLTPDFDLKAILHSFPKGTACGPSGLRIQHLIEVAGIPMQSSICAALRDIVNLLLSGSITSESGVQQGDPLGPLLIFCLVLHQVVCATATDTGDALSLFDDEVRQCFAECTAVDTPDFTWKQAQLSLSRGGLGLRHVSYHSPAAYLASAVSSAYLMRLRDNFNDFCHSACLAPQLEMGGWSRDRTHPADVLVPNWVLEACVTAGSAALAAQIRKHRVNDERCRDLGWACIPLVVETYGCWGIQALSRLVTRLSTRQGRPKSLMSNEIFGRLSLALVRVNSRAILSRSL